MAVSAALAREIRRRAGGCCEYCLLAEEDLSSRFEIDHITPLQHGGVDNVGNLALACFKCNRYKGPNLAGRDPMSGELTALFHPRRQAWSEHFEFYEDGTLRGITAVGRTSIYVMRMNVNARIVKRRKLLALGRYPCVKA